MASLKQQIRKAAALIREGKYDELSELWYYKKLRRMMPEIDLYKKKTREHILARAREVGCGSMKAYVHYFSRSAEEREYLRHNLTLSGSHFFRGDDWDYFITACLSAFAGREEPVRVWCAGCSTGEEVYSVLMGLMDYVPIERIELLATDYNETLLETVRAGEYSVRCYHETPERYRKYEQLNEKGTRFQMPPEICAAVRAERLDLLTDEYPAGFDVILCRNVLKFFNRQQIPLVQAKLAASLVPGGFLFTATDDQHNDLELVADPPSMGLTQLDGRCIYRKG